MVNGDAWLVVEVGRVIESYCMTYDYPRTGTVVVAEPATGRVSTSVLVLVPGSHICILVYAVPGMRTFVWYSPRESYVSHTLCAIRVVD